VINRRLIFVIAVLLTGVMAYALPLTAMVPHPQDAPKTNSSERIRGIEFYRQRKFFDAIQALQKAVNENKADDEGWYYLGLALLSQPGKSKDAAKAFAKAIRLRPNFAATHAGLAFADLRRNKTPEALREAQAAMRLDPSLPDAYYVIGLIRLYAGDAEEALSKAKEANRLSPEFPAAHLLKSEALVSVYAKRALGTTTFAKPQTPEEERVRRQAKRQEGAALFKEAAESLETYLTLNPSDPSGTLWREQLAALKVYGRVTGYSLNADDAISFGDEVTTRARVLMKPEPQYTDTARQAGVQGTVVLRAVFAADGTVQHILVLNGLPNGLTEAAIRAARQIKFTPATVDGRRVSMFIQLEYSFHIG
jgi:TonB family protein